MIIGAGGLKAEQAGHLLLRGTAPLHVHLQRQGWKSYPFAPCSEVHSSFIWPHKVKLNPFSGP